MKSVKLSGSLVWFIAIPSSIAFHVLIVFVLTFVLPESRRTLDGYAQLSPIQFVLVSGGAAQRPSAVELATPVYVEEIRQETKKEVAEKTENVPRPEEKAPVEVEVQSNLIEEISKTGSLEEETNVKENEHYGEDLVEVTEVVDDGILRISNMDNSLTSNTSEIHEEVPLKEVREKVFSESLVQENTYKSSSSYSERHVASTAFTIPAAPEQSVNDANSVASKAGARGNYESETQAHAMFAVNKPPPYPILARRNGWEGEVVLEMVISRSGDCKRARVVASSGYKILDKAAWRAAKQWKFVPAKKNNIPVESTTIVPVVFRLD